VSPYWPALRLIYVVLAVPVVLSFVVLVTSFVKSGNNVRIVYRRIESKPSKGKARTAKENLGSADAGERDGDEVGVRDLEEAEE